MFGSYHTNSGGVQNHMTSTKTAYFNLQRNGVGFSERLLPFSNKRGCQFLQILLLPLAV